MAVAIDACHCKLDICGRKHFHFYQRYRPRPQASAEDWYPILPLATSTIRDTTTYKCPQLSARLRSRPPWMLSISLQTRSWTYRRAFADASTLSTFMDASASARTCAQQCADADVPANASVCIHGKVLVRTSLLHCLHIRWLPVTLPGEWREWRGEQLTVTPVPRTSSGPIRQSKLDICMLLVSGNSYKSLQ